MVIPIYVIYDIIITMMIDIIIIKKSFRLFTFISEHLAH